MRTIELQALGDLGAVRKRTEGKIDDAVGYLVMWAMSEKARDDHVSIMVTGHDCEASAYYSKAKGGTCSMLIVAVWHEAEKRYSFHT